MDMKREKCPRPGCDGYCGNIHLPGKKKKKHVCCLNPSHKWES